ncbi:MAG TPA: VTT domain-containing protein [Dehalococcoidia bacterium]|nr:VTT domain-containing protein [Dehalococcoidia bacterium]
MLLSLLLFLTIPLAIVMLAFPSIMDRIGRVQLAGVFLVNFLVTLHVIPVPGVSALGQAVIVRQAASTTWPRWAVGLAGGLGMGLGELSPFYIGRLGSEVASEHEMKAPGPLQPAAEWLTRTVTQLMRRWSWPLLFLLSAVPNPFFEVAGLSAGSTRLSLWRFLPPTVLGKLLRGLILVYVGGLIIGA